jgi:hypothetical protein
MRSLVFSFFLCVLGVLCGKSFAEDPCVSGLKRGERPGPYSFLVATGPERGQSTCYICETGSKPAVVIFARTLGEPLGKLVNKLDRAQGEHKDAGLRAWVTFLSDDQPALDPKVVEWGREHAIRSVPLGVFEDADGPPSYRLARDADVTAILFINRKVAANFAFRPGELTEERAGQVLKAVQRLVDPKK